MASKALTAAGQLKRLLPDLLPPQGYWSEEQYLVLTDDSPRLIEFTDGYLDILPMPTDKHQAILLFLYRGFFALLLPMGGNVKIAPLRLRIRKGQFREPDLLLVRDAQDLRRQDRFWTGADLVLEVVSKQKPARDLLQKRRDYARAGIPEYWIVNPQTETITVLRLRKKSYLQHCQAGRDGTVSSALFPEFTIQVDHVLDAD